MRFNSYETTMLLRYACSSPCRTVARRQWLSSSPTLSAYEKVREAMWPDIEKLAEVEQKNIFHEELRGGSCGDHDRPDLLPGFGELGPIEDCIPEVCNLA